MGILFPIEIQCVGIPAVLEGKSLVLTSHSDSSSSLTYLLPLIQLLKQDEKLLGSKSKHLRAFVLCTTDELCDEAFRIAKLISHYRQLKSAKESGCDESKSQENASDGSIGLLIGTPDEVLQLIQDGNVVPDQFKYLVIDELDAMHDRGFGAQIEKVLSPLKELASKSYDQGLQTVLVTSIMTKMLSEHLSSFVERLESNHAGEVAAMLLEVDQKEVFHLIESPNALKQRVTEAMDLLDVATPGS